MTLNEVCKRLSVLAYLAQNDGTGKIARELKHIRERDERQAREGFLARRRAYYEKQEKELVEGMYVRQEKISSESFYEDTGKILKAILSAKEMMEKCADIITLSAEAAQIVIAVTDEVKKWCEENHIAYKPQGISAREVNGGDIAVLYDGELAFTIEIDNRCFPGRMRFCRPLRINVDGHITLEDKNENERAKL